MDNSDRIIALLENLNSNICKLTEAFNKHVNQLAYGPTSPPQRATSSKWEPTTFEKKRDDMIHAMKAMDAGLVGSKQVLDKMGLLQALDEEFAGVDLGPLRLDPARMQKLAGIKKVDRLPERTHDLSIGDYVLSLPENVSDEQCQDIIMQQVKRRDVEPKTYVSSTSLERLPYGSFTYEAAKAKFEAEGMEGLRKYAPVGLDIDAYVKKYGAGWIAPSMPYVNPDEFEDDEKTDPAIKLATPDLKAQRKKDGLCPECGVAGEWKAMACVCPVHGRYMG